MHKKGDKHKEETKEKISESLLNNSNAEKWTKDVVVSTLDKMIEFLNTPYEVIQKTKEENNHIGTFTKEDKVMRKPHLKTTLLIEFKIWYPQWFNDMYNKFIEDTTVSEMLKMVDLICEQNAYEDAANNATNPMLAKSLLARHYGWVDKTELQQKDNGSKLDLSKLTDDELREYLKITSKCSTDTGGAS